MTVSTSARISHYNENRMSQRDLETLKALAHLMDDAVPLPGTRFRIGLDALIGLIPGIGDVAGGVTTAYALVVAQRIGAPPSVLLRIVWNVVIDTVLGSIPFVGDVFDAGFRANRRNAELLERYALSPAKTRRSSKLFLMLMLLLVFVLVAGGVYVSYLLVRAIIRG
jgi:uncharacterized protein DUF4112